MSASSPSPSMGSLDSFERDDGCSPSRPLAVLNHTRMDNELVNGYGNDRLEKQALYAKETSAYTAETLKTYDDGIRVRSSDVDCDGIRVRPSYGSIDDGIRVSSVQSSGSLPPMMTHRSHSAPTDDGIRIYPSDHVGSTPSTATLAAPVRTRVQSNPNDGIRVSSQPPLQLYDSVTKRVDGHCVHPEHIVGYSAPDAPVRIRDDGIRVRAAGATELEIDPVTGLRAGHPALQPMLRPPLRKPKPQSGTLSRASSAEASQDKESTPPTLVTRPLAPRKSKSVPLLEQDATEKPKKKGMLSKLKNIMRSKSREAIPSKPSPTGTAHTEKSSRELSRDFESKELSRDFESKELSVGSAPEATAHSNATEVAPALKLIEPEQPVVAIVETAVPPLVKAESTKIEAPAAAPTSEQALVILHTPRPFLGSAPSVRSFGLNRSNRSLNRQQSPRSLNSSHSRPPLAKGDSARAITLRADSFRSNSGRLVDDGASIRRPAPQRTATRSDSCSSIGLDQSDRSRPIVPPLASSRGDGLSPKSAGVPSSVICEIGPNRPDLSLDSLSDHGPRPTSGMPSMARAGPRGMDPHVRRNSTMSRQPVPMGHPSLMRSTYGSAGSLAPHPMHTSTRYSFHSGPAVNPQHGMVPMGRSLSAVYPGQRPMPVPQSQQNFVWGALPNYPPVQAGGCSACTCCLGQLTHGPVSQGYPMGAARNFQPRAPPAPQGFPNQRVAMARQASGANFQPRPMNSSLAPPPNHMGPTGRPTLGGSLQCAPVNDQRSLSVQGQQHATSLGRSSSLNSPKGGPKPILAGPVPGALVNDPRALVAQGQPHSFSLRRSSSLNSPKGGPKPVLAGPLHGALVNDPRALVARGQPHPSSLGRSGAPNSPKCGLTGSLQHSHLNDRNFCIVQGQPSMEPYTVPPGHLNPPQHVVAGPQQHQVIYGSMGRPVRGLSRSMSFVAPNNSAPLPRQVHQMGQGGQSVATTRPRALVRSSSVILSSPHHMAYMNQARQPIHGHPMGHGPQNFGLQSHPMNSGISTAPSMRMGNRTPMPLRQDQPMLRRTSHAVPHSSSFGTLRELDRGQSSSGRGGPVAAFAPNSTFPVHGANGQGGPMRPVLRPHQSNRY